MRKLLMAAGAIAFAACAQSAAHAQEHRQDRRDADVCRASSPMPASRCDNGIKTYMKQHGDTVAGKKIEIIRQG